MSRDEAHGGGGWGFGECLWSPTRKTNNTRWSFWDTLLEVRIGDSVLHLRGKGAKAAFVGVSTAASNGFETVERPPFPGQWEFARAFHRVELDEYTPLAVPILLSDVFASRDSELRSYFQENKASSAKEHLFYVVQAGRLQCLNGAYLSQASVRLARLLLDQPVVYKRQRSLSLVRDVDTGVQLRPFWARVGQREFSVAVRSNYDGQCCFPDCAVSDNRFLTGSHIARWADDTTRRGRMDNGLCLCLMHDRAFEHGLFTLSLDLRVWVNLNACQIDSWAMDNLVPYHRWPIRRGRIDPSGEALAQHWTRTRTRPELGNTLDGLLARVKDETRHPEIDFGPDLGSEVLEPNDDLVLEL